MTSVAITFDANDGVRLEGAIDTPEDARAALVLCHPHPQMGGTMNAPLLKALTDDLVARGWAVLRFNFRGVGASEGHTGDGKQEVRDAAAALTIARQRWPAHPIALAGWSFGAAVALRLLLEEKSVAACVAIAPAVRPRSGVTAGAPAPETFRGSLPLLVVCGSNDDQVDPSACAEWAEAAAARYVELQGSNHFFWGRYERLAATVGDFLDEHSGPEGA